MEDKMSLEIKIVNATINIFKEKGVKFTMDDLANNLGVSKRTLYENIDSKETLLNLLVDDIFDSITEKGKEILNDATIDNLEKLKRILLFYLHLTMQLIIQKYMK